MCIIPSKFEFDDLEAQEREFEREIETRLLKLPEAERETKKKELLNLSVMRFAGIMATAGAH
jgi:hypothetical protein